MNYYDEEIVISGPDSKHLSSMKVDRLPTSGRSSATGTGIVMGGATRAQRQRQRNMIRDNSTDDDGLLQDIIDHDDEAEDSDEDDSVLQPPLAMDLSPQRVRQKQRHGSSGPQPQPRPQTRPGKALDNELATEPSDSDTEVDANGEGRKGKKAPRVLGAASGHAPVADVQLSLTPEMWEQLQLQPEVKDLFPYILKYTPQTIETPYHLQPFIPEFVPAVGDVDAFLKVKAPPLLQPQRATEVNEHLQRMGIYLLDEPSGTQSEPSLLNMKLRSVLTGSGANSKRTTSASLVPIAKSPKDIDKWIAEVEQVHMAQAVHETQPRKDIDALLAMEWPRHYAAAAGDTEQAYQKCLQEQITLGEYVRALSEQFDIEGKLETQADYILNVQTLFALYLAANQAWE